MQKNADNLNSNYKLFWDHAINVAFSGGHDLRKLLSLDEVNFRFRAPYSHKTPRNIFIYQAIDEAQKAATSLMRWKKFFSGNEAEISNKEGEDTKNQVKRITEQAVFEEQSLRCRKLTEILADTILFLNTNEDIYYKDYFCFCDLVEYQNTQKDRNEFFGFKSHNSESHIQWLKQQILEIEKNGLEIGKRWYLSKPESITSLKNIKLSSFRSKYKKISLDQNTEVITLLGKSYLHAYGESQNIHFSANDTSMSYDDRTPLLKANKVAVLLINLLLKAQELSLVSSPKMDKLLSGIKTENAGFNPYRELTTSQASIGDYVLAWGDLGQVIEERKSKYGYFCYNIRYIGKPPLEEIPDDWFASFEIRRIGNKAELLNQVKSIFAKCNIDENALKSINDKIFEQSLNKSIAEVLKLIVNK